MNFEIIDNAYQVTVLLICMLLSAWLGIRKKNRGFIMLSFGYGCFMMGTLFFVLYLAILGREAILGLGPRDDAPAQQKAST